MTNNQYVNQDKAKLPIRSYGRIKSRRLRFDQVKVLNELLPLHVFKDVSEAASICKNHKEIVLEIGFGDGGHLANQAKLKQNTQFIGCEPFLNGVINLLRSIENEQLSNVKIFNGDARVLCQNLESNSVDKVYILFPDPWPKVRHFKRRIINTQLVELLNRILKKSGEVIIATDHYEYVSWILAHFIESPYFTWNVNTKQDWQELPKDWVITKYQAIALKAGRKITYLFFKKR